MRRTSQFPATFPALAMSTASRAIIILGMHRSGTSCLAGMLAAGGLASAGQAVRNWDNARGHHEMLDVVRLNEAVLAHSGGHWLAAPAEVRWTDEHAELRDRLLRASVAGRPALLKDPRTLLTLPFWRASQVPYHVVAIVRHPLAVARSLESWRGMPLAEGVALWSAHNRALADDHARHGDPIIDFEAPRTVVIEAVRAVAASFAPAIDAEALAAAYEEELVHHDRADVPAAPGLDEAVALYHRLAGTGASTARPAFPRAELAAFERRVSEQDATAAVEHARAALAVVADAAAVLIPVVTTLVRHRMHVDACALIAAHATRLDEGLADLLHGKVLLAIGDARGAVQHLEAACAVPRPYFQARHLLPHALRAAGHHVEAREAMRLLVAEALYPHGPLSTLAEWSWRAGDRDLALTEMQQAIAAAPPHRRGRLRTRRAEWLLALGESDAARTELLDAIREDPGYGRSREVLATLG